MLTSLAEAVTEARMAQQNKRIANRIRSAVSNALVRVIRYLYDREPVVSITNALPTPCVRQDIERLVAYAHARELRCQGDKQQESSDAYLSNQAIKFFQGAIRVGVFEPAIRSLEVLDRKMICALMRELEHQDPSRWLAGPPDVPKKTYQGITTEDVEKMLQSSRACGPKHEVIMLILCTLGLRRNAIVNLRLSTVWDTKSDRIRSIWSVLEKNSSIRRISPCKDLCTAITRYVKEAYDRRCDYLFGSLHAPHRPPLGAVNAVLRTVCRRAGLPLVNPHRFRSYIVHVFLKNKNTLDQAAKFLGHKSTNVTFKHYWHPEVEDLAKSLNFFVDASGGCVHQPQASASSSTTMLSALEFQMSRCKQLEEENAVLRRRIVQLEGQGVVVDAHEGSTTSTPALVRDEAPWDPLDGFD